MAEPPPASHREYREQRQRGHECHGRVRREEVGVAHVKEIDREEPRREESFRDSKRENADAERGVERRDSEQRSRAAADQVQRGVPGLLEIEVEPRPSKAAQGRSHPGIDPVHA